MLAWSLRIWAAPAGVILLALAVMHARRRIRHMGHALAGEVFLFKSAAFWPHVTVAPLRKVQAVALRESPFDRRHGMARLNVDTAGAAGSPHRLNVPYLDRDGAGTLAASIGGSAAQSPLSW
jgi:putative membrane protein